MARYTLSDSAKKNYITKIAGTGLTLFLKALRVPDSFAEQAGSGFQEILSGVEAVKAPDDFKKHWGEALDRMWKRVKKEYDLPAEFWEPLEADLFRDPALLKALVESKDPVRELENEIIGHYKDSRTIDVSTLPELFSDTVLIILDEEIQNDISLQNSFYTQATDRKLEMLIKQLDKYLFKGGVFPGENDRKSISQKKGVSAKRYITDIPKIRYILDDYEDDEEFEFYPDRLYILSLYFIILKQGEEQYIVFDYVSYSPIEKNGRVNDDIWSVPYTIFPVDLKGRKVRSVRQIKNVYRKALEGLGGTLDNLEWDLFYNLGIVYKELEKGKEYIEYRRSTTEPDKMRCNYVREFFVHEVDSTGVINLVDPEGLHQHRYLPQSLVDRFFYGHWENPDDRNAGRDPYDGLYRFIDKPVPENVSDVLMNRKDYLCKIAMPVENEALTYALQGMLFRIIILPDNDDIGNYEAHKNDIIFLIEKAMTYGNIGRFCIEGLEVTGHLPDENTDICALLANLHGWINNLFDDPGNDDSFVRKISMCCTLNYCFFRYGKVGGLDSRQPAFCGDGYNELVRQSAHTGKLFFSFADRESADSCKMLLSADLTSAECINIECNSRWKRIESIGGEDEKQRIYAMV